MGIIGTIFRKMVNPEDITEDSRPREEYETRTRFNHREGRYENYKVKR